MNEGLIYTMGLGILFCSKHWRAGATGVLFWIILIMMIITGSVATVIMTTWHQKQAWHKAELAPIITTAKLNKRMS